MVEDETTTTDRSRRQCRDNVAAGLSDMSISATTSAAATNSSGNVRIELAEAIFPSVSDKNTSTSSGSSKKSSKKDLKKDKDKHSKKKKKDKDKKKKKSRD